MAAPASLVDVYANVRYAFATVQRVQELQPWKNTEEAAKAPAKPKPKKKAKRPAKPKTKKRKVAKAKKKSVRNQGRRRSPFGTLDMRLTKAEKAKKYAKAKKTRRTVTSLVIRKRSRKSAKTKVPV